MSALEPVAPGVAAVGQGLVNLPTGVSIPNGRETSQLNSQGQVVQGMVFVVNIPGGTTTSVFVPYSQITDTASVSSLIAARVKAIQDITG